jgi:hypothetical protein
LTIIAILIHLFGIFAFTYTGNVLVLYPAIAHLGFIIFIHIFGIGVILSPQYRQKWADKAHSVQRDYGMNFLAQLAMALTAYQLYIAGFVLLAGAAFLHTSTILISIILSKMEIKYEE